MRRERIAKLKAAAKTEEEIVVLKPTADYDAKFGVNERATGSSAWSTARCRDSLAHALIPFIRWLQTRTTVFAAGSCHRNIQHTVRYTELAPDRFKNFWR